MICAADGGVLDDLVVYRRGEQEYLVIANASNTSVVLSELRSRASGFDASVTDATDDYALIAVQGPQAAGILSSLTPLDLGAMKYYAGAFGPVAGCPCWVARTGYTGEDGFEVYCRPSDAVQVWEAILAAGAPAGLVPAGLAARDTLRLEAGMPLYGNELGPDKTPFEAGLGRVVKFGKPGEFVGREALAARAEAGPREQLVGLTIDSRRIARHGYPVLANGETCGTVTSGAPSPTLGVPIAIWLAPRRVLTPLATLVLLVLVFVAEGAAGASVIDRYFMGAATMLLLFCAVTIGGWAMLEPGSTLRRVWMAGAAVLILYGGVSAATTLSLSSLRTTLAEHEDFHKELAVALANPRVSGTLKRCPLLSLPNNKLIPDARWILNSVGQHDIVARSEARADADKGAYALENRIRRGSVAVYPLGSAVFLEAIVDVGDDPLDQDPLPGFKRIYTSRYYAVYANC